ncbi:glucose-6-phosphate 1-epimerase [Rheinheimera pacifica]|uniref:D-hexose-6-phosphate mutarotase n=1 Tax=Rheinheimera pacifica TaxID=173990 RepID=UPI0021697D2B|nr:D-hexose-6-phosphate mutarotase [Rheinheimera pacifica]MCS4307885.1 glucose-6-phosphate 1-epimerase [Rheinheimera pacifica]
MLNTAINPQTGFGHLTDLPCIALQFGEASAVVSLYGAQVLSYQPQPGKDVLWLSPLAQWHDQMPIRGGVPVCWPWFGPVDTRLNPQQQSLANHGVVRTQLWQLTGQNISASGVSVTLTIKVAALPYYPEETTLQLQLTLSDSLTISLTCNAAITQQAALHSYFSVANIGQTQVQPLPLQYQDKVTASNQNSNTPVATVNAEVDRIYAQPAAILQLDTGTQHLELGQSGQDATIVWNPWQDKSRSTKDLADDSYLQFICVETARLQLQDAAPLQLTQQIKLTH